APGISSGRAAKDSDEVKPFAEKNGIVCEFSKSFIKAHDVAGEFKAACAQRCPQETKSGIPLGFVHFLETDAGTHLKMLVHPFAPLNVVNVKQSAGELHVVY